VQWNIGRSIYWKVGFDRIDWGNPATARPKKKKPAYSVVAH
jgi:hypothetical protein